MKEERHFRILSWRRIRQNQPGMRRENYRLAEEVLTSEQDDFMLVEAITMWLFCIHFGTNSKESVRHLEKALSHQEYYESDFFFHSTYLISRELCVIGEKRCASQYIEVKGMRE
ncbi:hypothetical protein ACEQPO_14605 [Bacillus sp. SL00103]